MTARETFRSLYRRARIESHSRISPDYCATIEEPALGALILIHYDGQPCDIRREGTYRLPSRKQWHLRQAAAARRSAGRQTGTLARHLALVDHARHMIEVRRQL